MCENIDLQLYFTGDQKGTEHLSLTPKSVGDCLEQRVTSGD